MLAVVLGAAGTAAPPTGTERSNTLVERVGDPDIRYTLSGIRAPLGGSSSGTGTDTCGVEVTFSPQASGGDDAFSGALEAFALSTTGKIMHTFQRPVKGWEPWAPLYVASEQNISFRSGPVLVRASDGRLEVFANAEDTAIYHKYQLTPNGGGGWSPWLQIADSAGMEGMPSAIMSSEGSMQLFSRSASKALMYNAQLRNASGVYWAGWQSLSGDMSSSPSAIIDSESMLHVFVRGVQSQLYEKTEIADPATGALAWSRWQCLGGSLASHPNVPASLNGANLLEVYARHDDGAIWFKKQHATDSTPYEVAWSDWHSLGGPGESGGIFSSGPSSAHSPTCEGVVELFARASSGAIYHKRQSTHGAHRHPSPSLPTLVAANREARPAFHFPRCLPPLPAFLRITQPRPPCTHPPPTPIAGSSQWSLWTSLGGKAAATPASLYTMGGGLHVFFLGTDGQVHHTMRDGACSTKHTAVSLNATANATASSKWSGWKPLPKSSVPLKAYEC